MPPVFRRPWSARPAGSPLRPPDRAPAYRRMAEEHDRFRRAREEQERRNAEVSERWRRRAQRSDVGVLQRRAFRGETPDGFAPPRRRNVVGMQREAFRGETPRGFSRIDPERARGQLLASRAAGQGFPFEREAPLRYDVGRAGREGVALLPPPVRISGQTGYRIFKPEQERERAQFVQQRIGTLGPGGDKLVLAGAIGADEMNRIERGDPDVFGEIIDNLQTLPAEQRMALSADQDVKAFLLGKGREQAKARKEMAPTGVFGPIPFSGEAAAQVLEQDESGVGERLATGVRGSTSEQGLVLASLTAGAGLGVGAIARSFGASVLSEAVAGEATEQAGLPKPVQTGAQIVGGAFPGTLALAGPRAVGVAGRTAAGALQRQAPRAFETAKQWNARMRPVLATLQGEEGGLRKRVAARASKRYTAGVERARQMRAVLAEAYDERDTLMRARDEMNADLRHYYEDTGRPGQWTGSERQRFVELGRRLDQLETSLRLVRERPIAGAAFERIPIQQIKTRPDLFQGRDVPAGQSVDESRVQSIVDDFRPDRLDPVRVVRDPDGGYIVVEGHHRLEAATRMNLEDLDAIVLEGDIRNPTALQQMQREALVSNFRQAPTNIREQLRAVRGLTEMGTQTDEIAAELRGIPKARVDKLINASRLGEGVVDRLAVNPEMLDIASEIGNAVKFNLSVEDAGALFRRMAEPDARGRVITPQALRETLKKFAPKAEQSGLFARDESVMGGRGGLLGLMDEVARTQSDLKRELERIPRQLGRQLLEEGGGEAEIAQARAHATELRGRLNRLEEDLTDQIQEEAAIPMQPQRTGAVTFGEERYTPQFGSQQQAFQGEEGGVQGGMFAAGAPGGREAGQARLDELAVGRPAQDIYPETAPPPADLPPAELPPAREPPRPFPIPERMGQQPGLVESQPTARPPSGGPSENRPGVGQQTLDENMQPTADPPESPRSDFETAQQWRQLQNQHPLARLAQDVEQAWTEPGMAATILGRDLTGEELYRLSIPTLGDAGKPPTTRAVRAESADDNFRIPLWLEDIDEVAERWDGRYESDWGTWLRKSLGEFVPKLRTPVEEQPIRKLMVTHRLYTSYQSARMRFLTLHWMERNRNVLGLTGDGRARAVKLKPGIDVPEGAASRLDDIREHMDHYNLTPSQRRAFAESDSIFDHVRSQGVRHGEQIEEAQDYWPRGIKSTPTESDLKITPLTTQDVRLRTHMWYTIPREPFDVRTLIGKGYVLHDPLTMMLARTEGAATGIANNWIVKQARSLGFSLRDKIPTNLKEGAEQARAELVRSRRQALKSGMSADRDAALVASETYGRLKNELKGAGQRVAAKYPVLFGRPTTLEVYRQFSKYLETVPDGNVDDFFRVLRNFEVGLDGGSAMIQNWRLFWRDFPAWGTALGAGAEAIARDPLRMIVRHADAIERGTRYGAFNAPNEFMLSEGGQLGRVIGSLPGFKQAQRFFEWNIFAGQLYRWMGVEGLARSEKELLDLAATLRKENGSLLAPQLTRKTAKALRLTWFAPNFLTAMHGAFLDPVLMRGPARREAIRSFGQAFGGAAILTIAVHRQLNNGEMPNMWDPERPGLWGIRVGDTYIYPFGPFQPMIRAMVRTAHGDPHALPRFLEDKSSIPVRWLIRGMEAMGAPMEAIRGEPYVRPESAMSDLKNLAWNELMPIGPREAVQAISEGRPEGLLELGGVRTTRVTPGQKFHEMFYEKYEREYQSVDNDRRLVTNDSELNSLYQEWQRELGRRVPEIGQERRVDQAELEASGLLDTLGAGQEAGFKQAYSEYESATAPSALDELPPAKSAIMREYWAIKPRQHLNEDGSGTIDWEAFAAARQKVRDRMDDEMLDLLYSPKVFAVGEEGYEREREMLEADRVHDEIEQQPRYSGRTATEQAKLAEFSAAVDEYQREQADLGRDVSQQSAERTLAKQHGASVDDIAWLRRTRSSTYQSRMLNPAYIGALRENRNILEPWYPSLYEAQYIRDALRRPVVGAGAARPTPSRSGPRIIGVR